MARKAPPIITITLNPAIDRVLEVPGFFVGGHLKAHLVRCDPAGKGINVSLCLAKLGLSNVATGFVGRTDLPVFKQHLAAMGPGKIRCELLPLPHRTRQNTTLVDPIRHTDTHLREPGFPVTERDFDRLLENLEPWLTSDAVVAICGSLPPGLGQPQLSDLIRRVTDAGARLVLDMEGEFLVSSLSNSKVWMIKPNSSEVQQMIGQAIVPSSELNSRIASWTKHCDWIALSRGAEGAALFHDGRYWEGKVAVDPGDIVSTVGSGDCMVGGMIAALLAGLPPRGVLARGLAAATANACFPGVGEFDRELVTKLEAQVVIQ